MDPWNCGFARGGLFRRRGMQAAEVAGDYVAQIEQDGFAVVEDVVDSTTIDRLRRAVEALGEREEVLRRGSIYGVRNLLEVLPEGAEVAADPALRRLAEVILGPQCFAVRGTLFHKNP